MLQQIDIFNGQYGDSESDYRDNLPVNMYHVPSPAGGSQGYLRSQWGLASFAEGVGADQGGIFSSVFQEHYRVSGGVLISITQSGVVSEIGSISYRGQCIFNQTERNLAITTDSGCWLYNPNDGLRKITDPNLGPVFDTVYINQRLIHTDGEFIVVSDPGEDDVYDVFKYGTAEISPDPIVGLASISNRLLAIGRKTIEWFADSPSDGETFPYVRIESQLIEVGCTGRNAKIQMTDSKGFKTVSFIGGGDNDLVAFRTVGAGNAPKMSTPEIDKILQSYTEKELSGAILENRTVEASNFIFIHLARHTLSIDVDATSKLGRAAWTILKLEYGGPDRTDWINGVLDPRIGRYIYGDKFDNKIGVLDKSISTYHGITAEEVFYTPIIPFNLSTVNYIKLNMLPGRNESNTEPVLFISSSTDGLIYGAEYLASRGTQGHYNYNINVRLLDYFERPASYKFRMANNQPSNVASLEMDIT